MHPFYKEQIEREMKIRGLSDDTISLYCDNLKIFMRNFKGIKPSDVTLAAVKKFSEKLKNQGQSHRYINMQLASVRFFYRHVCKANFDVGQIPRLKEHKKLPIVFSREEIKKVLDVTTNIKHKARQFQRPVFTSTSADKASPKLKVLLISCWHEHQTQVRSCRYLSVVPASAAPTVIPQ